MSDSLKMLLSGMQPSRTARRPALRVSRCGGLYERSVEALACDAVWEGVRALLGHPFNPGGGARAARDPQLRDATRPAEMNSSSCIEAPPTSRVATQGTERARRSQPL